MEKEMINVNDIAYAVMKDGSVINNFGDVDEKDCNVSISNVIKPICYALYNILKAIVDKKGKLSKEFFLVTFGMLNYDSVSRKAFYEYLRELRGGGFGKKAEEE